MANTIQIKRSSTASDTPSASDLSVGELAVNTADAKLFTKHTDGTVKELAGGGGSGMPTSGGTFTGNVTFNDDVKAIFGTSDDGLEIVHDGSNSRIKDVGTGSLLIGASFVGIQKADGSETAAKFFNDGAVELYHDNSKKIESTSSGATVTGILVADGLDIARDTDAFAEIGEAHIGFVGHSNLAGFSHIDQNSTTNYSLIQDANGTTYLNGASGRNVRHRINNVEVMTMSGSGLDITGDLTVTSTDAGATENPTLDLYRNSASPADDDVLGHINFTGENDADEKIVYAEIESVVSDVSDGSEDSKLNFRGMIGGSQQLYMSQQFGLNYFYRDILLFQRNLIFEGATADDHETTLTVIEPTSDNTVSLPDQTGTAMVAVFYDSYVSANQTLSSSYSTIDFDTNRQNSDTAVFSESAGEVTVAKAGVYLFSFQLTIGNTSTSRSEGISRLQRKASGGDFAEVAGSTAKTYHRNNSQDGSEGSVSLMYSVTAGDVFRVQAKRNSGGGSLVADGNGCRFNIMALKIG